MKPVKVIFDRAGNTLNVWFDDPKKEFPSEVTEPSGSFAVPLYDPRDDK